MTTIPPLFLRKYLPDSFKKVISGKSNVGSTYLTAIEVILVALQFNTDAFK